MPRPLPGPSPWIILNLDLSCKQEFAWPEEDLPKRKAERGSSLTADTAAELAKEPMFCFEVRRLHPDPDPYPDPDKTSMMRSTVCGN